jgi:hypothetical protein
MIMPEPCVSMGLELFEVDISAIEPPDWESLESKSSVLAVLDVIGSDRADQADPTEQRTRMLKLAVAITSFSQLQTIHFDNIHFEEFGHFCVAATCQPRPLLTLRFDSCDFNFLAAKALQFLLESSSTLEELSFTDCSFDDAQAGAAIRDGLAKNQSLRKFQFILDNRNPDDFPGPIDGVHEMLNSSKKIVALSLSVTGESFWDLFLRAAHHNKTLESLSFHDTHFDYHSIQAILFKCFILKSLKELGFHGCHFANQAVVDLFVKAVSENKILDSLCIDRVSVGDDNVDLEFSRSCGQLQVSTLRLNEFEPTNMLDDVASNPNIKCLDLKGSSLIGSEVVELCHVLLLPNCGLLELLIDGAHDGIDELLEAFQQNVSVQSLTIGGLVGTSIISFAQALANMQGLRKLSITSLCGNGNCIEQFFQRMEVSLEQNTTLQTLALVDFAPNHTIANKYLPKIRYYLAINRVHRDSLLREPLVPAGVCAHVLSKTSNEAAGINFILRSKPDIVVVV